MDGEIGSVVGAGAVIWSDLTTDAGDKGGPRIQLARRNLRVVWSVGVVTVKQDWQKQKTMISLSQNA